MLRGYPSDLLCRSNPSIKLVGKYFSDYLTDLDYTYNGKYKQIVIAAHSMGGLVVRSSIIQALENNQKDMLRKIKQIVLFGVPNDGHPLANIFSDFVCNQVAAMGSNHSFIKKLRREWINRVYMATEDDFDPKHLKIPTLAVPGLKDVVVPEKSVRSFFGEEFVPTDGTHVSMVKPEERDHRSYEILAKGMQPGGAPPKSCLALKVLSDSHKSGRYTIDPDGNERIPPFPVYCEMKKKGGGWTLFATHRTGKPIKEESYVSPYKRPDHGSVLYPKQWEAVLDTMEKGMLFIDERDKVSFLDENSLDKVNCTKIRNIDSLKGLEDGLLIHHRDDERDCEKRESRGGYLQIYLADKSNNEGYKTKGAAIYNKADTLNFKHPPNLWPYGDKEWSGADAQNVLRYYIK